MHYVRLLRPPTLSGPRGRHSVKLVLTITTDLGDSFLHPETPMPLDVIVQTDKDVFVPGKGPESRVESLGVAQSRLIWKAGMRVLKVDVQLPVGWKSSQDECARILITPTARHMRASTTADVLDATQGRVMPVVADLPPLGQEAEHVCFRRVQLFTDNNTSNSGTLELEEDLGDSIARHVWDGGLFAVSLLVDRCLSSAPDARMHAMPITRGILLEEGPIRILELGSGVGTLGLGLATILRVCKQPQQSENAHVLLTDVAEAQERASANIRRWGAAFGRQEAADNAQVSVDYEVLDWEDGRLGRFPSTIQSRLWNLIVLSDCTYNTDSIPSLVETLSSLHRCQTGQGAIATRVLLATKPRHSSETVAFELLAAANWKALERVTLPLPLLGHDDQSVEIYLYQKQ